MPGKRMASIKRPKMYEGLRKHGFSKERAAKISNAFARRHPGRGRSRRK
jgi:hypothetical protein